MKITKLLIFMISVTLISAGSFVISTPAFCQEGSPVIGAETGFPELEQAEEELREARKEQKKAEGKVKDLLEKIYNPSVSQADKFKLEQELNIAQQELATTKGNVFAAEQKVASTARTRRKGAPESAVVVPPILPTPFNIPVLMPPPMSPEWWERETVKVLPHRILLEPTVYMIPEEDGGLI